MESRNIKMEKTGSRNIAISFLYLNWKKLINKNKGGGGGGGGWIHRVPKHFIKKKKHQLYKFHDLSYAFDY